MSKPVAVTAALRLTMDHAVPPPLAKELRRADDFIRLAVVTGFNALAAAPVRDLASEARGIFIGTAFGPLETNFQSLGSLINDGEGQISPTLFSHSVYNSAAGYTARLLDFQGPALTVTDYGWPFLIALEEAHLAVASGRVERALVLGVEVYSELLADAYRRSFADREVPWHKGAVAWVLDRAEAVEPRLARLESVTVTGSPCATGDYLTRAAELCRVDGRELVPDRHTLAAVESLSDLLNTLSAGSGGVVRWECSARFGSAVVRLAV
ncbi:MAG TPA: beta-ketoacyl synthase N-terminal-like domain-containing protein [Desulfurivibrionaceae bacterium]|nr:beta-ketoacyl synthase N-terminal-like domain-containing protein [Desulfurivibrionaceae bacterium]